MNNFLIPGKLYKTRQFISFFKQGYYGSTYLLGSDDLVIFIKMEKEKYSYLYSFLYKDKIVDIRFSESVHNQKLYHIYFEPVE